MLNRTLKYSVVIRWSEEDALYIASLPEFGPYCSAHGSTYEDAAKNAAEVLAILVDSNKRSKQPLPTPNLYSLEDPDALPSSAEAPRKKVGRKANVA